MLIKVISDFREFKYKVYLHNPIVHCKVLEDNYGALDMA